jgi:hypothetical protein
MADATSWTSAGSQVAAMLMGTGNMVVGLVHTIPCRLWFQPFIAGIFSRSIAGAVVLSSEIFSSGVSCRSRSSTRFSIGCAGSR